MGYRRHASDRGWCTHSATARAAFVLVAACLSGANASPVLAQQRGQDWFIPGTGHAADPLAPGSRVTTVREADIYRLQGNAWVAAGRVAAGTMLTVRQPPRPDGYVLLHTPGGWEGLIHRDVLQAAGPGSRSAAPAAPAQNADACAGPGVTMRNGWIAHQPLRGPNSITVENRMGQIGNVKLRDTRGRVVVSFFVGAEGRVTITGIPDGAFRVSFLSAERWRPSRQSTLSSPFEPCGEQSAQEFDGIDDYRSTANSTAHWTYTIFAVRHGNARTSPLDTSAFLRD